MSQGCRMRVPANVLEEAIGGGGIEQHLKSTLVISQGLLLRHQLIIE